MRFITYGGWSGRTLVFAAGCLAALLCASCAPSSPSSPSGTSPSAAGAAGSIKDDLANMKGTWERQIRPEEKVTYKRCVKEIGDGRETVTYYDADGKVTRQHTVDFKLERHGPVRLFTFWNHQVTAGPDAGERRPEPRSYVYRISGDELAEVWGFLPGQEERPISYHTHRRIKAAAAAVAK